MFVIFFSKSQNNLMKFSKILRFERRRIVKIVQILKDAEK